MPDDGPLARAALALDCVAVDPGLGGVVLRARAGPARDLLLTRARALSLDGAKIHPQTPDEALFGGLDVSATLATGRMVNRAGLLEVPGPLTLTMAERCPPALAARLAGTIDRGEGHTLLVLDEGAAADETCPAALEDRLAFHADLDGARGEALAGLPDVAGARAILARVTGPDLCEDLSALAVALGIVSLRAPLLAARAARVIAALAGRVAVEPVDVARAAALVLPHRATRLPEPPEQGADEADAPPERPAEGERNGGAIPDEILLEAVAAHLPPDLLARIGVRRGRGGSGSGTGNARSGNRRGRPLPSRPGRLSTGQRLDLVATLRAAAPWQRLRAAARPDHDGLHLRPSDLRLRRYEERSDRLLVFTVDASGSAAFARLAEAKGAIEILLGEAYARRDHVALVAFRGTGAETLLSPTRSLVQTKRRLAALPGGGGTPLAAGLEAAFACSEGARRRGLTPTICLLTDGRANIALDGTASRPRAGEDANRMARRLRSSGADAIVIDVGTRPDRALRSLAQTLDAPYIPLPRADAHRLSGAVAAALGS